MKHNFDRFFDAAVKHEGKVREDVPGDRGGPTYTGITLGRLATIKGVPEPRRGTAAFESLKKELYALSDDQIKEIYRRDYWDAVKADDLPEGVDYCVADFGLNSGPSRAVKYLQRQMGNPQTGKMDEETLKEVHGYPAEDVITTYCAARIRFLKAIVENDARQGKFLKGWLRRVSEVQAASLKMAEKAPPPAELEVLPKAVADDPKPVSLASVAVKSKSFWINVQTLLWAIIAPVVGLFDWLVQTISGFIGIVPDIKDDIETVAETGSTVAGYLQLNAARIVFPLIVVALVVVTYRHVRDKREMSQ